MAITKKTDNETGDGEDTEELESSYTAGGNANAAAILESKLAIPQLNEWSGSCTSSPLKIS